MEAVTWEMRAGNCLDPEAGLPSLGSASVDHVITDPPYSAKVHRGFDAEQRLAFGAAGDIGFGCLTEETRQAVAEQLARILRRWAIVFTDDRGVEAWMAAFERAGLVAFGSGVWVKTQALPRMAGDGPAYGVENIVFAHARGRRRWNGGGRVGVWRGPPRDPGIEREHPTQKPLWLFDTLVRDFTEPGELVCDPFTGSGTTGIACVRLGRRFVGWELDPTHAETARRRIGAAREQLSLFSPEAECL